VLSSSTSDGTLVRTRWTCLDRRYESLMGPRQLKWSDKKKHFLSSYTISLPSQIDPTNTTACVCWVNRLKCENVDVLFIQCHTRLWWLEDNL